MRMTLEEIYTPYADEYIEEHCNTDCFRSMNNPKADDHEREREHFVDLWLDSHWSASGKKLSEYYGDDEFYTNGNVYYPKEYAEAEMYEHEKAIAYIDDRDFKADLQEYCEQEVFTDLWLGYDYPQVFFKKAVKAFVFEDYDDYMDYIMEAK